MEPVALTARYLLRCFASTCITKVVAGPSDIFILPAFHKQIGRKETGYTISIKRPVGRSWHVSDFKNSCCLVFNGYRCGLRPERLSFGVIPMMQAISRVN